MIIINVRVLILYNLFFLIKNNNIEVNDKRIIQIVGLDNVLNNFEDINNIFQCLNNIRLRLIK